MSWVLQQDNDPEYTAKNTQVALPIWSPNPIEYLLKHTNETCGMEKVRFRPETAEAVCSWGVGQNTCQRVKTSHRVLEKLLDCSDCLTRLCKLRVPSSLSWPGSFINYFLNASFSLVYNKYIFIYYCFRDHCGEFTRKSTNNFVHVCRSEEYMAFFPTQSN